MDNGKRAPRLIGLIPIGGGLVAVGIATKNPGLLWAGVVFIIIGVADIVRSRKSEGEDKTDSGGEGRTDS